MLIVVGQVDRHPRAFWTLSDRFFSVNGAWLREPKLLKLYFYAEPGALNPPSMVEFFQNNPRNRETRNAALDIDFAMIPARSFIVELLPEFHEFLLLFLAWMGLGALSMGAFYLVERISVGIKKQVDPFIS